MATVRQRVAKDGSERWQAQVRRKGFPLRSESFDTEERAQLWAKRIESEIEDLRAGKIPERTLAELLDRYISGALRMKNLKSKEQRLQHLEYWRGELGTLKLSEVTVGVVAGVRDRLLASGKTAGTCNRYLSALGAAFKGTMELGWTASNPVRDVLKPTEPKGRTRFLDREEMTRLLAACAKVSRDLADLATFSVYTGCRQSEAIGLRWQNVDMDRRQAAFLDTKNGTSRSVALVGPAFEVLTARKRTSGLVFGLVEFPRSEWNRAVRDSGIENFVWHDLRHSCASFLAAVGASLPEIGAVLGHKSALSTARYSHLATTATASILEKMAARLG